jgi:hypothetical protein
MRFLHYGGSAATVPPKADMTESSRDVSFVPMADIIQ